MKNIKKYILLLSILMLPIFLSACGTEPINSHSKGFWDGVIVYHFSQVIVYLSKLFGYDYGLGIIFFTIGIRIIVLPLMIYQVKTSKKMAELQPHLKKLQDKHSAKDVETQQKLREEQQKLYAKHGVNPLAGCLPLLVQLPILYALYAAVSRTQALKHGHFMWLLLGEKDPLYVLPVLAALFTFFSSWLMMKSQPESNSMTSSMTYVTPLIILFTALSVPSAVSLYWVTTNLFQVVQTLILQNPFKIKKQREQEILNEKHRDKAMKKAKKNLMKGKK